MNELEDKLKAAVLAAAITEVRKQVSSFAGRVFGWAVPALAAMAIALFVMTERQPEDTFDSPELAYAEVERTFALISQKIEQSSEIVETAEEPLEMIQTLFK